MAEQSRFDDPGGKVLKATFVSLLDKLMADGALHGYQVDEEVVHSTDVGTMFVVVVTNGPEGVDKFNAALEEAEKSNPAAWAGLRATLDPAGHRDMLARVGTMTHK